MFLVHFVDVPGEALRHNDIYHHSPRLARMQTQADAAHCRETDVSQGYMSVDEAGHETWHSDGENHNQSRIAYSDSDSKDRLSFELNQLVCKPTGPWSSSEWVVADGFNCWPGHGATDVGG